MYRKKQSKVDGNILFTGNHLRVAVLAVVALVSLHAAPGWAQSTNTQSSSQGQASQKPDQTPAEAGGPENDVGPMAVPKKKESTDDTPPPPKPKKQADAPEYSLRVDVPVVTVDARVVMKDGRPLAIPPNVAKEHFKIWEDGVPQKIQTVTQSEAPITAVLLVEQLLEKALATADRVYALVQGHIVLEAQTSESNLPQRLERAYFGHDTQRRDAG